jgi:hypothetical protein
MKAGIGTLPHDDERWAYEIKPSPSSTGAESACSRRGCTT